MLKYRFENSLIKLGDNAVDHLETGYPKVVPIEAENFSDTKQAVAFRFSRNNEVFLVRPCGKHPTVLYNDGRAEWTDFELIEKTLDRGNY